MSRTRVIGLGQALAGDDSVGLAVIEELRERGPFAEVELVCLTDVSALLEQLCDVDTAWVVDAVDLRERVGEVVELGLSELDARASCSASSHGLDAAQAIALCRELFPTRIAKRVRVLGIGIDVSLLALRAPASGNGAAANSRSLSPRVARGAEHARELILDTLVSVNPQPQSEIQSHA